uniref:ABM domain-containing protein n=2 Tax=Corethron hystrix TaxID=216773 RepID=A0A7S1BQ96_9STRA|mmetsp:Transcript_3444/g.6372  ORF Transcript_3444/g.6372 Transcript_3444/m.6372 type:complete len:138 (+) Transcript_3444:71-484(+)
MSYKNPISLILLGAFVSHVGNLLVNRRRAQKAWTLCVTIAFQNESDMESILDEWKKLAGYCARKEPFLLHYEVGVSDSDALTIHVLERYRSKTEYLQIHKKSDEFLKFRPKLAKLQEENKVTIDGFSYRETGLGFTS